MERLVRALSIRQPIVELILEGREFEFRSRPTNLRERVYLYASNELVRDEGLADLNFDAATAARLPRGLIVGSVEIIGCLADLDGDFDGYFAWHLSSPVRYPQAPGRARQTAAGILETHFRPVTNEEDSMTSWNALTLNARAKSFERAGWQNDPTFWTPAADGVFCVVRVARRLRAGAILHAQQRFRLVQGTANPGRLGIPFEESDYDDDAHENIDDVYSNPDAPTKPKRCVRPISVCSDEVPVLVRNRLAH